MERDLSNKRMFQDEEAPETGAGSEFGKKLREVSRRKKFGFVPREFKLEDQPWLLRVNGKAGRKFKGQKKGGVTDNACYYIFTQCPDGAFEAFPVHTWYNFSTVARHRTLTAEEAEEEWDRRNKVVNHFSIMLQRRLKDQDRDDGEDEEEEKEKGKGKGKGKAKGKKKSSELKIHDLEDDLEMSSTDESEESEEGGEERRGEERRARGEESEEEGIDEASDSSEESEEEKKEEKKEDEEEEEDEEEGKKTPVQQEKKKKKGTGAGRKGAPLRVPSGRGSTRSPVGTRLRSESRRNEAPLRVPSERGSARSPVGTRLRTESRRNEAPHGVPSERGSARSPVGTRLRTESRRNEAPHGVPAVLVSLQRKKTPPKRPGGKGSAGSSRSGSRPGTPSLDSGSTSSTLHAVRDPHWRALRRGGADGPRIRAPRSVEECRLQTLLLQVRELGLGYDSEETVLFKYCSGGCPRTRTNHDLALSVLLQRRAVHAHHSAPCCRPTRHEDVAFLDSAYQWHKVEQLSAAECGCVG
ncbi:UNVERIFIED_CONTAM: hypothetical protein FKN15_020074 [Acipenser sinensis]